MYAFSYHRPTNIRAAASLLAKQDDAKLIAGGHTLLPTMKLRLAVLPPSGKSVLVSKISSRIIFEK